MPPQTKQQLLERLQEFERDHTDRSEMEWVFRQAINNRSPIQFEAMRVAIELDMGAPGTLEHPIPPAATSGR